MVFERKESTNFLGIFSDNNLNRKDHILHLSNRLALNIALLKVAATYLPKSLLQTLYKIFFHSRLTYATQYWFYASSTTLQPARI